MIVYIAYFIVSLLLVGMIFSHCIIGSMYKLYFSMEKNKKIILIVLFGISLFWGVSIYRSQYGLDWYSSIYYGLTQFLGEVKLPAELGLNNVNTTISSLKFEQIKENYSYIYYSAFFALLTSFLTLLLLFFKDIVKKSYVSHIRKGENYILVIGLGENNRAYISSEITKKDKDEEEKEEGKKKIKSKIDEKNIIVIEQNKDHPHINYYESKGIGFLLGTIEDHIEFIKKRSPNRIIISVGNDRNNIDIASTLQSIYNDDGNTNKSNKIQIYIHLDNHNYEAMYRQRILSKNKQDMNIEYKPYSFYDDAARNMLMNHTVLGNYNYNIDKCETYNVVLVGSGKLAERILYHLCMIAHLPNKNIFNIICIDENAQNFLQRVRADFTYIDNIRSIKLCALEYGPGNSRLYRSNVWGKKNLTNVILCDDDENINLENAVNMYDKVFLKRIKEKSLTTKILIAMYHNLELGKTIYSDQKDFKNFYTFGSMETICSKEHLLNETQETLAQLIHHGYGDIYDTENKKFHQYINSKDNMHIEILKKWRDSAKYTDRESNRSQALHIDTKLLTLGLRKKELIGKIDNKKILEKNIKLFDNCLFQNSSNIEDAKQNILYFSEQLILSYRKCPFDEKYIKKFYNNMMEGKSLLSKLMKSEHERWNAFHYLNGWEYNKEKNKPKKEHDCLIDIENFTKIEKKLTIIYDLYSVLYIPSYLASVGYEIETISYNDKPEEGLYKKSTSILKLGVIGKNIDIDEADLKNNIDKYDKVHIYSALVRQHDIELIKKIIMLKPQKIQKIILPVSKVNEQNIEEIKKYLTDIDLVALKEIEPETFRVYGGKGENLDNVAEKCVCQKSDMLIGSEEFTVRCIKVGVTGHRVLTNENSLKNKLQKELEKFPKAKKIKSIISPLADGADRVVAEMLIDEFNSTLIVPLPFEKDEYIKDFSPDSKKEFDSYLEQVSNVYEVGSLKTNTRDECYLNVGKEVVDTCDILIALWDGKKANGVGGTGDVVAYAKKKRKAILHINTDTFEVEKINFEEVK